MTPTAQVDEDSPKAPIGDRRHGNGALIRRET
ncbi:MAG: hypothetical protein V7636_1883 [Actinomycetota bacterium]